MTSTGLSWEAQRRPYIPMTCANDRCGEAFVARHPSQRYCGPACAHRATSRAAYRRDPAGALARQRVRRAARRTT